MVKELGYSILRNPLLNRFAAPLFLLSKSLGVAPSNFIFAFRRSVRIGFAPGKEFLMWNDGSDTIAARIRQGGIGAFEADVQPVFQKWIRGSRGFLDIGANSGFYSLFAAAINPNCNVVAFEPLPSALKLLRENVARNNFENVEVCSSALSNESKGGHFFVPRSVRLPTGGSEFRVRNEVYDQIPVLFQRLDSVVADRPNLKIDFMKIDTESSEPLVIQGGLATLQKFRPVILIEILSDDTGREIEKLFSNLRYNYYQITHSGLKKLDTLIIGARADEWNFLFVPIEKDL